MISSELPLGAFVSVDAASRMSCSRSFADSPDCQRLLQRVMEAGMGWLARQVPLANWKKSVQGSVLRSRSVRLMPWEEVCDSAKGAEASKRTSRSWKK